MVPSPKKMAAGEKMLILLLLGVASAQALTCPDGTTCKEGSTCCQLRGGDFGCCHFEDAVCCPDQDHCCPSGYTCGQNGTCMEGTTAVPMTKKYPSFKAKHAASENAVFVNITGAVKSYDDVVCPDGNVCDDGSSCCLMTGGNYGCCPFANAVCCADKIYCCPSGYQCDSARGRCIQEVKATVLQQPTKFAHDVPLEGQYVQCPDQSICGNGSTCCLSTSGRYHCCPYSHAVCCSDHLHCCPEGYRCQLSSGSCVRASVDVVAKKLSPATPPGTLTSLKRGYVQCPDQSFCPTGNTCCLLTTGRYGCCPYAHAECCSDHKSCCPEGYRCQVSTQSCLKGSESVAMSEKRPSISLDVLLSLQSQYVPCPDQSFCPSGNTCCLLTSGRYGCCPFAHAECCSDHRSCCPEGYRCHISTGTCTKGSTRVAMSKKRPSLTLETAISSLNELVQCPSNSTRCPMAHGDMGCCPYEDAQCCPDGIHCCRRSFSCDSSGTCVPESPKRYRRKWLHTAGALLFQSLSSSEVTCPDNTRCPGSKSCCKREDGRYGCCPFPEAVCCHDGIHCCPKGHQCNISKGNCEKDEQNEIVPMLKGFPSTAAP